MHLTKSVIAKAHYPAEKSGGAFYLWHDDPRGLGLRIYPSGLKTWVVHFRHKGRRRFKTVGPVGVLTLHQARRMAIQILGRLWEVRSTQVLAPEEAALTLSLKALGERFLKEKCKDLKAKTQSSYETILRLHLYPALGHHAAVAVERDDVLKLRESMAHIASTANRAVRILQLVYSYGEEAGAVPVGTNPCQAIPKFLEGRRERYLSPEEIQRLAEAFQWVEENTEISPYHVAALKVLLLTGCRRDEIRTLKWSYVDFDNACIAFPDSKTGAKTVPVGSGGSGSVALLGAGGRKRVRLCWRQARQAGGSVCLRLECDPAACQAQGSQDP